MNGAPARRPTQARGDQTRRGILDATVASLMELGYARTTTLEVQRRAGVSRGALLHHFPSKTELLVAAVRYLAELRGRELKANVRSQSAGGDRLAKGLDLLWESFSGPLFYVAMELRIAARTDAELRDVLTDVELEVRHYIVAQCAELFGPEIAARPEFETSVDLTLQLMIGTAMSAIVHRDSEKSDALIRLWKKQFPKLLENAP